MGHSGAIAVTDYYVCIRRTNAIRACDNASKKQVPFDFAQGRLSTSLAALRFGRDDSGWEF